MAKSTFIQNIRKIRGEAIYGPEMRTAIADAITQAINLDISGDEQTVLFTLTRIDEKKDSWLLDIRNQ